MTNVIPEDDANLLEAAAEIALSTYAEHGKFQPFGLLDTKMGIAIVPAESIANDDEKRAFVNMLRFLSVEHDARATAIAMETWTLMSRDPEDHKLLQEIYKRGGSMSEHPKAGEAIMAIVESDAGASTRMHRIVRAGDTVTLETASDDFRPAGDHSYAGTMAGFHIPAAMRKDPQVTALVDIMRARISTTFIKPSASDDESDNSRTIN